MSPSPRLDGVELVLVVGESVLYGIFLVHLSRALESLFDRRKRGHDCTILLSMAAFLTCTITAHFILDITRAFDAFIYAQDSDPSNLPPGTTPATLYFEDLAKTKYVVVSAFYVVTTAVGDGFMIYRAWIVWNRNLRIVFFPLILEVALCAVSGVIVWLLSRARGSIFVTAGGWITAYFILTFLTNLISSLLISYRIWLSNRNVSKLGALKQASPIQRVIHTLIQSAALYSVCLLLSMALYVRGNNIQYILAATNCPIVGIIFTMIAARSGKPLQGTDLESETHSRRTFQAGNDNLPLRPMTIKITTEISSDDAVDNHSGSKATTFQEVEDASDIYRKRGSFGEHSV